MKLTLGTKITTVSVFLCLALVASACSSLGYDSAGNPITSLNVSNNFTGPQGPTGATGPNDISTATTTSLIGLLEGINGNVSSLNGSLAQTGYRATWNGTGWGLEPPAIAGEFTYYLTSENADIANYYYQKAAHNATGSNITATVVTNNQTIGNWTTQTNIPNVASIPAGIFSVHLDVNKTAGTQTLSLHGEVWEVSAAGADIALIGMTENSATITSGYQEFDLEFVRDTVYTMNSTASRIVTRVHGLISGGGTSPVIAVIMGGVNDSHMSLPSETINAGLYVPYVGAVNPVNLGSQNFTTTGNISALNAFISTIMGQAGTDLSGNLSAKLNTSNVTATATANKTPQADGNGTINTWIDKTKTIILVADTTNLTVGNGTFLYTIPGELNNYVLLSADAAVTTNSTSGAVSIGVLNYTTGNYMLSTNITIDVNEATSYTGTSGVVNSTYKTVTTGQRIRFDVISGVNAKGLQVILTFRSH